ncbi:MAG: poly-gamma-glutamate biosynthesis protein PgsC/CapC [Halovenus sp.]
MLVVTALTLIGLMGGIMASQLRGFRLGGVIIVPLFAVYTLRSFGTFPVLMMSVIGGYVSVWIVKRRLLLYGRMMFIVAIVASALVPLGVYVLINLGAGPQGVIDQLGFIGSVLPGIAVYNFHRLSEEKRVLDAVWSMALLLFLVVVGIGLVILVGLTPLSTVTPPVLLGPDSDIARAFGLQLENAARPTILPFPSELGMLGLGLFISEGIRSRWGLRTAGLIVLPLLVLFAFRNGWLLATYILAATAAYVGIQLLHRWTLVYGRVLLSMGVSFGLLTVISVVPTLPISNGLLPFFTGVLGGVGAYNLHAVAPAERRASLLVSTGVFVVLAGIGRVFLTPLPEGILTQIGGLHLFIGGVLVALAGWEAYKIEKIYPSGLTPVLTGWESGETGAEGNRL